MCEPWLFDRLSFQRWSEQGSTTLRQRAALQAIVER
jgi:trimethylamine:corrinoid methyltransferase-like protein